MGFWIGIVFGVFTAYAIIGLALYNSNNKMCSGQQVVIEKTDTIRTFSCTVELKRKDEK